MTRGLLGAIVSATLLCGAAAPAFADHDDHHGRSRGQHEHREDAYHGHRGGHYYRPRSYYYEPRPEVYYYAPPPVYVPPRPPSFGLNLVFPFHFD